MENNQAQNVLRFPDWFLLWKWLKIGEIEVCWSCQNRSTIWKIGVWFLDQNCNFPFVKNRSTICQNQSTISRRRIKIKCIFIGLIWFQFMRDAVTPQIPDLKIHQINAHIRVHHKGVSHSQTIKSLNKINFSLSFAKCSIAAAEIIIQILQKSWL